MKEKLSRGVQCIEDLKAKVAKRSDHDKFLAEDLADLEVQVEKQRKDMLKLIEQRGDLEAAVAADSRAPSVTFELGGLFEKVNA